MHISCLTLHSYTNFLHCFRILFFGCFFFICKYYLHPTFFLFIFFVVLLFYFFKLKKKKKTRKGTDLYAFFCGVAWNPLFLWRKCWDIYISSSLFNHRWECKFLLKYVIAFCFYLVLITLITSFCYVGFNPNNC